MAEAVPPKTRVYRFLVPVVFKKLEGKKLKAIEQKKRKALVERINPNSLGDHMKKSLPDVHVESLLEENEKISVELVVSTTGQLQKVYKAAEKLPEGQYNDLSKSIHEYSVSLVGGSLTETLHVQAIMTHEQFEKGMTELDEADDENGSASTADFNSSTRGRQPDETNKNQEVIGMEAAKKTEIEENSGESSSRMPGSYPLDQYKDGSMVKVSDEEQRLEMQSKQQAQDPRGQVLLLKKKLIVHIPVKKEHVSVEKVEILRVTNMTDGIMMQPRRTEKNMFEVEFDVHTAVFYMYKCYTREKGFLLDWKDIKYRGYFQIDRNPVQRDIFHDHEYECIAVHLSDIIFFPSGMSDSEHVTNSITEIDNLLHNRGFLVKLDSIKNLVHFLFKSWFQENTTGSSLLLLVVLGKLLKNVNVAKQLPEIDDKTSFKLLQDIKKFRLVDLPPSCEGYMVDLCICLCKIYLEKKFCLLLFMYMCHPFLDALHFNMVISRFLKKNSKIPFVSEDNTDLVQVGKELCSTMYTLHLTDDSSNREQSMKLLQRLLLHLPIVFLPPIMTDLCWMKDELVSPSEEALRKELNGIMINSIKAEVQKTSSPSDLYKVWSVVRPVSEIILYEVIDSFDRKLMEIIKFGKNRFVSSDIEELKKLFSDTFLLDSGENQYSLLAELADSRVHIVHDLFILCLELKKFAKQKENICELSVQWLSRSIGTHSAYKSSEILAPYKAVSRLLSTELISMDSDTKSALSKALFKELQKRDLNTVLLRLGDDTEIHDDKYISDVFVNHVADLIKEKYKMRNPDELLQHICSWKNLVVNSRSSFAEYALLLFTGHITMFGFSTPSFSKKDPVCEKSFLQNRNGKP